MTTSHDTVHLTHKVTTYHLAWVHQWTRWLLSLDAFYVAHYGLRWIKRDDGSLDPMGLRGVEVGTHWLRENRYMVFPGFLDYEPTNLFLAIPELRQLFDQIGKVGVQ